MPDDDRPHLLHFRISHYNEKVRWALDHKRWAHTREALVPGFHIPRVRWLTGQSQVPVLVLDGRALVGSSRILAEIERRRPDPPLVPEAPADQARARELERHFDEEVAPDLRRLFWSTYLDHPEACATMATDGASGAARRLFRGTFPVPLPAARAVARRARGAPRQRGRACRGAVDSSDVRGAPGPLLRDHPRVADSPRGVLRGSGQP